MACYNNTPLIVGVQYPQPCDCCTDPNCASPINATCVYYNGPVLPCSGINTGDNLETALEKIEEQICAGTGDYSTYNTYCLAPISTQQEFVEAISEGYCNLLDDFDTFVNTTFVNYQTSVTNQFNAIINPAITCSVAGVTNTDTLYQVLNKYCTTINTINTYVNIGSVNWDCIVPGGPVTSIKQGFEILIGQICSLSSGVYVPPTFNNLGSCLPTPGAADSLVDTINKIKTRLCQTPTFDINALTWGCIVKPSSTTTDLQSAFASVLANLNDYIANKLSFSPDFTITATDPMDPCAGKTLNLTTPVIGADRKVASNAFDASPGTLADKVTAGTSISLDFVTTPGQMIINSTSDTYKVKADSTDLNPNYLIDKVTGVFNTGDGVAITDSYDPFTENVLLTPSIDWTTFITKMFTVIEGNATLYAKFCELACACDCTSTTTSTTTSACADCFTYSYGPAASSCTIEWTNCDGTPGSAYVSMGDSYLVPCMRPGTGTGCGPWTEGFYCDSYGPGCTTTTTTTAAIGQFELRAAYGLNITDVAPDGTGFPLFSYPVNSGYTQSAVHTGLSAQTFEVTLSGTRVTPTTMNVSLVLNSFTILDCSNITTDGSQTHYLTSPVPIGPTDYVYISIGLGGCPVPP